jgi:hypothetical protein
MHRSRCSSRGLAQLGALRQDFSPDLDDFSPDLDAPDFLLSPCLPFFLFPPGHALLVQANASRASRDDSDADDDDLADDSD